MPHHFDRFAKQLGREVLEPSGLTIAHHEISPESQHADLCHEPDPARDAERHRLGLLGRIAASICLIEIYSHVPDAEEFRACLGKHIAFWHDRARKARASNKKRREAQQPPEPFIEPFLWIITAGTPMSIVTKLRLNAAPGWPRGIYLFGDDVLRVGLVLASELPGGRSTLLVRLMAAGPLLAQAAKEVAALPPDAYERIVAERLLLHLQHALKRQLTWTPEEQEFIMAMYKTWEEWRIEGRAEGHAEGRAEGHAEGLAKGQAHSVLAVLGVRGIAVPDAARECILAEKDPDRLQRWLERATAATSITEVIDDAI
jgi:hypothetical protein